MVDKTLYDKNSIESLSPLEFTRLRPGVYAGNTTYSTQLLIEVVSNAVDEFRLGHGDKILVTLKGKTCIVEDFGQGFLVNEKRDDGTTVLEAAFSILNTSGKYREDGTYEGTSLGSFGIGSKITNFLSHWLEVITYRDNKFEHLWFKEGVFDKREVGNWQNKTTGTLVQWEPSEEFFTNVEVEVDKIKTLFKTIVCLCPGLTIELDNNGEKSSFYSANGLSDLADDYVKENELINNRLNMNFSEGKYKLDLILTYTSNYSSQFITYVNAGLVETSPILTQIKTTITREMNKFFREKGWLKDKDENLTGDNLQEGMFMVFNATCPSVAYDSQVKTRVVSMDCKNEVSAFSEEFINWLNFNEKEVKLIADKAINARKAAEAARKAREAAREGKKPKKAKVLEFDSKLADASEENRKICELYVVEGDSAGGNLKKTKNTNQAVLPIRGKMLNTQNASVEKIRANQEIITLFDAIGLNYDKVTLKVNYNENDLRYGKIVIMSDADVR